MSEKNKKEQTAPAGDTAAEETAEQTAAPAGEAAQEETFTVTKSQMEQMEQLAKVLADATTSTSVWRRSTTTTASAPPARRRTSTTRPRPTPSSRFWRCWTIWSGVCSSLRRATATGRGWR